jgi:3-hydroxyacyl-CoA dehydrogenase/enoyl-CoA hydratase/3-hydroxybutyryl-CoA epimerase
MSFGYDKDAGNIVTVTMDMPGRKQNVIDREFGKAMFDMLDRLQAEQGLAGVILMSAKKDFVAGADIDMLFAMEDPEEAFNTLEQMKAGLRRLETLGRPVVAAMNGTALGGGYEVALACHHRVAVDDDRVKIGFPEVTLGLMPAGGGVSRLPRMIGLQASFPFLCEGRQVTPKRALEAGLVDELAVDREDMLAKARAWIAANPDAAQPWDQKGYRMPGGDPRHPKVAQMLAVAPAILQDQTYGNYPAPLSIMSAAVKGAVVPLETSTRIESRHFAELVTGKVAKNMIRAFWYQLNEINGGGSRPDGVEPIDTHKVGVLGAGLMGHGIAYVTAAAGMDVVLKEVTRAKAEEGKARVEKILAKGVEKGRTSEQEMAAILDRILPTDSADDLTGCDLIVEAVFENRELKAKVTQEAEARITDEAVFGSNTSTLPITGLATASARPDNFIGIHFFSPVHRMRLVEIICGEQTSDRALAKVFDYVLKIRKTPIVVNDSRGFYTSRVFGTYINEGTALLWEGNNPRTIEVAGRKAGMPVGPLALYDEVGISLAKHIRDQTRRDLEAAGETLDEPPHIEMLDIMVTEHGRGGRAEGGGFYDYPDDGPKHLWPKLTEMFPLRGAAVPFDEMIERIMFAQAIEAARCFQEGVVRSVADANIGSVFGWGFAPFKGGTLQYINDYGMRRFVERSRELAASYGPRFDPPEILLEMAKKGNTF